MNNVKCGTDEAMKTEAQERQNWKTVSNQSSDWKRKSTSQHYQSANSYDYDYWITVAITDITMIEVL